MKGGCGKVFCPLIPMTKKQLNRISQYVKDGAITKSQAAVVRRKGISDHCAEQVIQYFKYQKGSKIDSEQTAKEAAKYLDFIQSKSPSGELDDDMGQLIRILLPRFNNDTLIGKSKRAIYFAYTLYRKYTTPDPDPLPFACNDNEERLNAFVEIAYHCSLSDKQLLRIGRYIVAESPDAGRNVARTIRENKSLVDDFVHNGNNALLVHLMDSGIIASLASQSSFDSFYDWKLHQYSFNVADIAQYCELKEGFRSYYTFDSEKVALLEKNKHPFFNHILGFAKKNLRKDQYANSVNFAKFDKYWLESDEMLKKVQDCYALMGKPMEVYTDAWSLTIKTSVNYFAQIHYKEYKKIFVDGGPNDGWRADAKASYEVYLFVTPDGKLFRKQLNERSGKYGANRPVSFQEMMMFLNKQNLFSEFIQSVIDFYGKTNKFIYDFISDCSEKGCLIPATFDDVVSCYNRAHFIKSKYKTAQNLKINWNKRNLNISYMIIKAYPIVEEGISRRILEQVKDVNLLPIDEVGYGAHNTAERKTVWFVKNVILSLVKEAHVKQKKSKIGKIIQQCKDEASEIGTVVLDDELAMFIDEKVGAEIDTSRLRVLVSDYVNMCRQSKKKIRLDIRSVEQMDNLHDFVAHGDTQDYYRTNTRSVSVPKDSKFNELRKILPNAFEWITNRKRLILETELQHHCVWSYADKISSDRCAIYSFVDSKAEYADDGKAKRYTIEFCQDQKGEYYIQQVQGKYDRMHTQKMAAYIQKLLDDAKESAA